MFVAGAAAVFLLPSGVEGLEVMSVSEVPSEDDGCFSRERLSSIELPTAIPIPEPTTIVDYVEV